MKKTFNLLTKKLFLLIVGVGAFSVLSASTFAAAPNGSLVLSGDANYAVNQAATLLGTTLTITDSGTEITAANDIHVKIPAGLNMEWDTSVTTVGITQSGNGVTSTTPTYVGTTGVTFDVTTNFDSGENVQITGLKVSSFTAGATADTLEWAVDNATYASGTFLAGTGDITVGAPTISATAQVFSVNQADTAMGAITIAEGTAIKINTDEDIRLTLPGATGVGLTWDDADVGVVCTDAGATTTPCLTHFGVISGAEITLTVDSYVANPAGGADKTLVIPVTADFDEVGDSVTFSGVNFEVGSVVVTDSIELEVAGANLGTISTATTGANVTIGGAPTFASAAAQTFYTGMSAQPVDWVMTITENATAPSINVTDDIRIVIPPTMYMQWDSSDASILVNGSDEDHITKAAGGACTADASDCTVTVTFSMADGSACTMASGAECKVMIIPVQAAFEIGDDITVTGALLAEFTQETTAAGLGLEIAGANYGTLRTATDSQTMEILVASSAAGNDKTGPVAPTAFAVSDQGVLTWTDPTDTDLKEIEVLKK